MPKTKAQMRAKKKYDSAHYESVRFDAPIGFKERVKEAAQNEGISPSQFMRRAILEALECSQVGTK